MTSHKDVLKLSVPDLCDWLFERLEDNVGVDCIQAIRENQVNGMAFVDSTESDLKELCPLLGERKAIQRIVIHWWYHHYAYLYYSFIHLLNAFLAGVKVVDDKNPIKA